MRVLPLVNVFDVSGEHTGLHVRASCSKQDIVGVPVDREDGRADRLLQLFRHPPVVVRVE